MIRGWLICVDNTPRPRLLAHMIEDVLVAGDECCGAGLVPCGRRCGSQFGSLAV